MTDQKTPERISDEMLDQLIGDADATELFQSGELLGELKRKLAERILDAEMAVHLSQEQESNNVRNGHNNIVISLFIHTPFPPSFSALRYIIPILLYLQRNPFAA